MSNLWNFYRTAAYGCVLGGLMSSSWYFGYHAPLQENRRRLNQFIDEKYALEGPDKRLEQVFWTLKMKSITDARQEALDEMDDDEDDE